MAKQLKQMLASEVRDALTGIDGAVFVNTAPMTVELSSRFRAFLRKKAGGACLRVVHNRTARHALVAAGFPEKVAAFLKGPTAVIYGGDGPASVAKSLAEWVRTDKKLVVKGAIAEGEVYEGKAVTATLATMPDKNTLRAMLLGAISGPARGLAVVLSASAAGLARATKARIDKGGFAEGGAPAAS